MSKEIELISFEAAGELLCPGNPPHPRTMKNWFASEAVSPIVEIGKRKHAIDANLLRAYIARRAGKS